LNKEKAKIVFFEKRNSESHLVASYYC